MDFEPAPLMQRRQAAVAVAQVRPRSFKVLCGGVRLRGQGAADRKTNYSGRHTRIGGSTSQYPDQPRDQPPTPRGCRTGTGTQTHDQHSTKNSEPLYVPTLVHRLWLTPLPTPFPHSRSELEQVHLLSLSFAFGLVVDESSATRVAQFCHGSWT